MNIAVKNLKKSFDGQLLFENLSFELKDGDVLGILGKSGKGKTTLINILLGLEKSDEGEVTYSEEPCFSVVFQENLLFEEKTVYENVKFVCDSKEMILKLLNEIGLGDYLNSKVSILSGGMKRKLSLVRAAAKEGNIFITDEAIREVDSVNKNKMVEFLMEHRGNNPLIYITHDEEDLKLIGANKIIRLKD
ncbi:ATP-binding cassette domain-containing protein [Anaerosphaera multitolerans]|uniref:ABC transporter ATP-binding protein n=1 Tax=Anaerosphaera multitolerans TaxID=2487351 RepID=A0A437S8V6_9FIRM|nr:ATP-binding cassette domain-containing protein [Anaerosphaera multitolerans]RVU55536.1 ABC transporter ATP-binding protein [Anaerosphaera multitolerans]